MNAAILIPARWGSTRFDGKPSRIKWCVLD